MKKDEGFAYIDTAAIQIVLANRRPSDAKRVAKWLREMVQAKLARTAEPGWPRGVTGLSDFLDKSAEYGFVLGNYETVASQIEFLLKFEETRQRRDRARQRKAIALQKDQVIA